MKSIIAKILTAVPIAICIFAAPAVIPAGDVQENFLDCFLWAVSPHQRPIITVMPQIIKPTLSIFIFLFLFMNFMYKDFMSPALYAFIRRKSRINWYFSKTAQLLLAAAIYYILYFGTGIGLFLCLGAPVGQLYSVLRLCAVLTLLYAMLAFVVTFIANLLAICFNSACGYGAAGFILLISLSTVCITNGKYDNPVFKLNPIVQLIPDWHSDGFVESSIKISGFPLSASVMYFAVVMIVLMAAGFIIVRKTDITLTEKD